MKRLNLLLLFLLLSVSMASAQSVEAVKKTLKLYPDLAYATYATYPAIPLQPIVEAPKGYEPFYISTITRHGSRYQNTPNKNFYIEKINMFKKLDEAGLLTDMGKQIYKHMCDAEKAQEKYIAELSPLGARQLRAMGERAYARFTPIFKDGGNLECITSVYNRCMQSLQAYIDGVTSNAPNMKYNIVCDEQTQYMLRPYDKLSKAYDVDRPAFVQFTNRGAWLKDLRRWAKDHPDMPVLKYVFTDVEAALALVKKLPFDMAHSIFNGLLFMKNFEVGDPTLHAKLFSEEEIYNIYVYKSFHWMCTRSCENIDVMKVRHKYIRPLLMHFIDNADAVLSGKSDAKAHLRCTHDTNIMPLLSLFGFKDAVAYYKEGDVEQSAVSAMTSKTIPMAANLQLVFYRNAKGNVLVRVMLNEQDEVLPIKTKTPMFYRWKDLRRYLISRADRYEK